MQLVKYFNQFMKDTVNLNQSRINILDQKAITIDNFINNSDTFKANYKDLFSQGSYKHETIIKPPKSNKEFDADLLLELETFSEWESNPSEYINELYKIFKSSDRYKNIVIKNTRCVTLNYSGDFHIDIVPLVKRSGSYYIINKSDNVFEKTNPIEYTAWLMDKHRHSRYQLKKIIRLFKYMRDIKQTFTSKSILLNTMLASQVNTYDTDSDYSNLPTAFKTIINRLNDYLQTNYFMPHIYNPTMPEEDFMRNWTQDQYSNFRDKIKSLTEKTNEAYNEEDQKKSIKTWRKVFGDKFPDFERSAKLESVDENYTEEEEFPDNKFSNVSLDYNLKISCTVKGQAGFRDMLLQYVQVLFAQKKLEFNVDSTDVPEPYEIWWKVKNEGHAAKMAGQLRGSIFKGNKSHIEPTKFKGAHYVECYIVKDNICVAMDRIDVPIEIANKKYTPI
ncbi:cyclic GMP-AMP synthase DncV-like nucleotidyltransferase [Sulfurospirillum sp. hDNRA2]|uniref:nucleotide-binding domain-containing protein n=1 Tax=Sulfurospirillum sp. hDNRA2 TaxID=3237298 RepID=UPI0020B7EF70|nr:hypothetical protein [Sulfurospirillum sp. DNRA8]MCP3651240.1 hypothetical protein [Sulfurospirillum sp. DNRA8]MCR1810086.1 hypothetical protein [Sulfurospirillum sp. DNRA8]